MNTACLRLMRSAEAGETRLIDGRRLHFLSDMPRCVSGALTSELLRLPTVRTAWPGELKRLSLKRVTEICQPYGIVSFDLFDTLLYRTVGTDENIFRVLEIRNRIPGFAEKRRLAEKTARERSGEPDLRGIYQVLAEQEVIRAEEAEEAMNRELALHRALTAAEPFWLELTRELKRRGKILAVVSDMYLTDEQLCEMLESLGFPGFDLISVSCREGAAKAGGALYRRVSELAAGRPVLHIGNDPLADGLSACRAGLDAALTVSSTQLAASDPVPASLSLGRSVIQALALRAIFGYPEDLFAEEERKDPARIAAYAVTGPLTVGFCGFVRKQNMLHHWKRLFFASRDGWMMHQVYNRYFGWSEYLPLSRAATQMLDAAKNPEAYVRNNLQARMGSGATLGEILPGLGLSDMLEHWRKDGLSADTVLTRTVMNRTAALMRRDRTLVAGCFQAASDGAERFFSALLHGDTEIAVADTGWKASSVLTLESFFREKGRETAITSLLMGTLDTREVQTQVDAGRLVSWLYGPEDRASVRKRQIRKRDLMACSLMEMLYMTDQPPLLSYEEMGGGLTYGETDSGNERTAGSFERGILTFASDWFALLKAAGIEELPISPEEYFEIFWTFIRNKKVLLSVLADQRDSGTPTPDSRAAGLEKRLHDTGFWMGPVGRVLRQFRLAGRRRIGDLITDMKRRGAGSKER